MRDVGVPFIYILFEAPCLVQALHWVAFQQVSGLEGDERVACSVLREAGLQGGVQERHETDREHGGGGVCVPVEEQLLARATAQ